MNGPFSVKLKSKKGQFIVKNLNSNTTVADLKTRVAALTQVAESQLNILIGFPPRPLDLTRSGKHLKSLGISNGETLIVDEKPPVLSSQNEQLLDQDKALMRGLQTEEEQEQRSEVVVEETMEFMMSDLQPPQSSAEVPSGSNGNFRGILQKKTVPADNSCLFTSIRFVLNGIIDIGGNEIMRQIIAQEVAADPEVYNDAVLGKSNPKYCDWIQRPDSWGGAIEISILSNFYGIEIDVVDVQNGIINRFGEDRNYDFRVFLLFDGLHYDPLYLRTNMNDAATTIFPVDEMDVYNQAEQLANEAKASQRLTNYSEYSVFSCLQCNTMLMGQSAAQQHAETTGHTNFHES